MTACSLRRGDVIGFAHEESELISSSTYACVGPVILFAIGVEDLRLLVSPLEGRAEASSADYVFRMSPPSNVVDNSTSSLCEHVESILSLLEITRSSKVVDLVEFEVVTKV